MSELFYRSFYGMGTRFEMVIPEAGSKKLEHLAQNIEQEVLWWQHRLSRFEAESDISRLNREGALHPVEIDQKVFSALQECDCHYHDTGGLFDPAILTVQTFWKDTQWTGDPEEAEERAAHSGWKQVHLDPQRFTVRFETPETGIDPGAFGKGLALREAGKILRKAGITDALLSFGGSSILGLGRHPHGPHWPAGITNIFQPHLNVHVFPLRDAALSSSGASLQRQPAGPNHYLPVFHPRTGLPVQGWRTVSVTTADPMEAEVLSTAFLVANGEERNFLTEKYGNVLQAIEIIYKKQKANIRTFVSHIS